MMRERPGDGRTHHNGNNQKGVFHEGYSTTHHAEPQRPQIPLAFCVLAYFSPSSGSWAEGALMMPLAAAALISASSARAADSRLRMP